jgi:hypothetical protein
VSKSIRENFQILINTNADRKLGFVLKFNVYARSGEDNNRIYINIPLVKLLEGSAVRKERKSIESLNLRVWMKIKLIENC